MNEIDFGAFEEAFKLNPAPLKQNMDKVDAQSYKQPGKIFSCKTTSLPPPQKCFLPFYNQKRVKLAIAIPSPLF